MAWITSSSVSSVTISAGEYYYVASDGIVNTAWIQSDGTLTVSRYGTATDITISSGGEMNVQDGGSAADLDVQRGGELYIYNAEVSGISENGGYVYIGEGANAVFASNTLSGLIINSG